MMTIRRFLRLAALAALFHSAPALRAEAPFSLAATPGKLPKDIMPRNYAVRLVPDLKTQTLSGSVTIDLEVLQPTRRIVLNARELEITKALLLYGENRMLKPVVDAKEHTVSFDLPIELKPGRCELALEFKGKINKQPQGLYRDPLPDALGRKGAAGDADGTG